MSLRCLPLLCVAWLCACDGPEPIEADRDAERADREAVRIVTLAPHLAEIVFAAGAGEHLVGVSAYSDFPEAVRALPIVSDGFALNAEALMAVEPTVILAWSGGGQSRMVELAASLGIELVQVPGERLADIAPALRLVGELAGTSGVAEQAAREFEAAIAVLQPVDTAPAVFYQIGQQPLYTVGGRHYISDVIKACGGRNVFAGLSEAAPAVALEAVVAADPRVILTGEGQLDAATSLWSRWPALQAVQRNAIMGISADLVSRPGPRLALGADQVCARLREATGRDR